MTHRWARLVPVWVAAWLVAVPMLRAEAATPAPTPAPPPVDALIIGFDVSRSIDEEAYDAAREAAKGLVTQLNPAVPVGLLAVGGDPRLTVGITPDRGEISTGIDALTRDSSSQNTFVFAAIDEALEALSTYGATAPQILLFTDGVDEGDEELATFVARVGATTPRVAVSTIFIPPSNGDPQGRANLDSITQATGGQVYDVDQPGGFVAGIQEAFDRAAQAPALEVTTPPPSLTTVVTTPPVTTTTPPPAAAAPPAAPRFLPDWTVLAAGAAAFVGLLSAVLVVGGLAGRAHTPKARRRRGLEAYTLSPRAPERPPPPPTRLGDNALIRSAVGLADRVARERHAEEPLARRLEAANLPLRPGEWLVLHASASVFLGLLLLALSGGNPAALLIGTILGGVGLWFFLSTQAQRRRKAFHAVLPDTLGLLASTLRVGYSLPQAMDTVVREGREPIRTEFNRALVEARLGVPAENTLDSIAERVDSDDFRWVVMAIRIQRDVGGNLAELLDTVAETMRDRARLRRQVDTLSAEGRISAWVIGGLPVVFIVYLLLVRPSYLAPLVQDPLGLLLMVLAVTLLAGGVVGLRWAIKVDV